jgi:serine/threonine-protein kinase
MEFIDGMSLRDLIKRQGALAPAHAVPLFKQALAALDYAHNFNYLDESGNRHTGIIHRDIKPANLLLDGMARLKITDFGIVKLAGERGMTRTGFNPGTAEYMSPEQIRGLEVDARSDIYSLGVTFYEALTGRLPFPHPDTGSEYEVLRGHIELAPPPIATLRPDVPGALAAAVMRSLEKDPNARFQSGAEFLEAILDFERNGASLTQASVHGKSAIVPPSAPPTHSMTEPISYDTRPAPLTAAAPPPAPPQPSIETRVIAPATTNHRGGDPVAPPSRRYGLALAVALVTMIAVVSIFMFLKRSGASSSAAANASISDPASGAAALPTPTAQPAATQPPAQSRQEDERLKQGREAEADERYLDAIKLYREYLKQSPKTAEGAAMTARVEELKEIQGLLSIAELELNQRDYKKAKADFTEALKLRPESKRAKSGIAAAESHLAEGR